jgi:hypothetical protein
MDNRHSHQQNPSPVSGSDERVNRRIPRLAGQEFISSNTHTVSVYYLSYCDRLLQHLDTNPTFWRLFGLIFSSGHSFRSLKMLSTMYMDIPTAGQYRLFGHGNCMDLSAKSVLRIGRGDEKCSPAELKALNEWAKYYIGDTGDSLEVEE